MKVPDSAYIQKVFKYWWKEAVMQGTSFPVDQDRYKFHRPSSLPFCPVAEGYKRLVNGVPKERYQSFTDNYYVDIGSKVHFLLQRFLGSAKLEFDLDTDIEVLGHWECPRCMEVRKFSEYAQCKCGGTPTYKEIEIRFRKTRGHLDKLIRINKMLIPIDYKTTSSRSIYKHRDTGNYFPFKENRAQITRYVSLFERAFKLLFKTGEIFHGCSVVGGLLVYVSRESPRIVEFIWIPASEKNKLKWYRKAKKDDRLFQAMNMAIRKRSLPLMLDIVKEKPCSSKVDYEKKMSKGFGKECPLLEQCFNAKALRNRLRQAIDRPEELRKENQPATEEGEQE